jgi:4-hydroxy-tetrahydrodipicolinate reductase
MIRVAVAGALGRMGTVARGAIEAVDSMAYVGGLAHQDDGVLMLFSDLDALIDACKPNVLLDFTTHPSSVGISTRALQRGVSPVIGTSGWTAAERDKLGKLAEAQGLGALLVPNFAVGAVLMMHFAQIAAKFFPTVEIVEMHHDKKKDAPSGTSRLTAERIRGTGTREVPIHSVRLRGLVAHQEVLFGGEGELLTMRHDSLSRQSFVLGIVSAIHAVGKLRGLHVGLDAILGLH